MTRRLLLLALCWWLLAACGQSDGSGGISGRLTGVQLPPQQKQGAFDGDLVLDKP